jgi:hypothetical protein
VAKKFSPKEKRIAENIRKTLLFWRLRVCIYWYLLEI